MAPSSAGQKRTITQFFTPAPKKTKVEEKVEKNETSSQKEVQPYYESPRVSVAEARGQLTEQEYPQDVADDDSTEFKLATLLSLYPNVHHHALLDMLLNHDGSVEEASLYFSVHGLPVTKLTKVEKLVEDETPETFAPRRDCSVVLLLHAFLMLKHRISQRRAKRTLRTRLHHETVPTPLVMIPTALTAVGNPAAMMVGTTMKRTNLRAKSIMMSSMSNTASSTTHRPRWSPNKHTTWRPTWRHVTLPEG